MSCRVTSRPKHFLHFRFFCNRPTSPFVIFFILSSFVKYIYIYIRGGTVHRCHGSVCTSVRGSRFVTISVQQEKKEIYYARFLFIYFEQTVVQIKKKIHLDVKILNIITLLYIYNLFCFHCECTQIKPDLYTVIINKTISV